MKKSIVFTRKNQPKSRWSICSESWWSVCSETSGQFTPNLGGQFDRFFHLVGQNANMNADYNENNRELTISIPGGSSWMFKKIK